MFSFLGLHGNYQRPERGNMALTEEVEPANTCIVWCVLFPPPPPTISPHLLYYHHCLFQIIFLVTNIGSRNKKGHSTFVIWFATEQMMISCIATEVIFWYNLPFPTFRS